MKSAVHLGGSEFIRVHPMGQNLGMESVAEVLAPSIKATFDDLVWWAKALTAARAATLGQAA